MKIFYFSATGNSLCVAKKIGGELCSIPQMIKEDKRAFKDDVIGFVIPCYFFGMPRFIKKFILNSKFEAKYFFAIVTCGNMAGASLKQMEEAGRKVGIQFNYTNEIMMVDNYLPMFDMEKELEIESSKKIDEKLALIVNDIKNKQEKVIKKGIFVNAFSKTINRLSSRFFLDKKDASYIVLDSCNACGICAKVCPVKNIKVEKKPVFSHKCEGCYACIHHCPQNAIHFKSEKSKARFINRNVKLTEIIDGNDQNKS